MERFFSQGIPHSGQVSNRNLPKAKQKYHRLRCSCRRSKIKLCPTPTLDSLHTILFYQAAVILLTGAKRAGRSQMMCRAAGWSLCHWGGSSGSPTHAAQPRSCRLLWTGMLLEKVRLQDGKIVNLSDLSLKPPSQQFSKLLFPPHLRICFCLSH